MSGGFVYFMTNRRDGILYTGVTSDLPRRAFEHRNGIIKGFSCPRRRGHPRVTFEERNKKDVDGWDKPGHDEGGD